MAFSDLWRGGQKGRADGYSSVALDDMLRDYDLLEMYDEPGKQFAIVSPKVEQRRNDDLVTGEWGTSAPSPWTSFTRDEYNPALRGEKGLQIYDKMRRSDGAVRGTLRGIKTPVLAARWFMEPGGDKAIDKKAAEWCWKNLTELMSTPWMQTLTESLLMLDFGYYMMEKVWTPPQLIDGEWRTVLKKLGPRHPMDVKEWHFDANGGPKAVTLYPSQIHIFDEVDIPIKKMLVFTFDKEAGNIEGISVLRSAYKHWYYKEQLYKIDAIQKERHGIGIPIIKLPVGYKREDKVAAENLGRNIRTNERAHIVLPPGWEIMMLKLEGQPVDCLKSIEHHDDMILINILGLFFKEGSSEDDQTMFLKATRFIADIIADTITTYLLPEMTAYNFAFAKPPRLKARRIGESADWRTLSFAIRNMVGAGVIKPDDKLEEVMREEMDLPLADPETTREVATPQAGPNADQSTTEEDEEDPTKNSRNPNEGQARVGAPRQVPVGPGRMRNQRGLPRRNAGTDQSGGR